MPRHSPLRWQLLLHAWHCLLRHSPHSRILLRLCYHQPWSHWLRHSHYCWPCWLHCLPPHRHLQPSSPVHLHHWQHWNQRPRRWLRHSRYCLPLLPRLQPNWLVTESHYPSDSWMPHSQRCWHVGLHCRTDRQRHWRWNLPDEHMNRLHWHSNLQH
ncbi:hypothetical protein LRHP540_02958 [Lacticaseibacillus rhamnosus]|nr:hypothetical protein LRHP540_01760 [Lacticaseibacillus rhamnosus]VTZ97848.1 hypothetical protein LRHP540_02958 [Lacticaseibacillus rhamnosus]